MESLAKKIIAEEYAVAYGFDLPEHLVNDVDYASLRTVRKVPTVGYTFKLEYSPEGDAPYARVFRGGLQFIHRLHMPLIDYVKAALHLFRIPESSYEILICRTDKRVGIHVDNNIKSCILIPLLNGDCGETWFATPSMDLATSFKMMAGRAYLANVSEYHGFNNPASHEVWFLRVAFPNTSFSEMRQTLDMMLPRMELR